MFHEISQSRKIFFRIIASIAKTLYLSQYQSIWIITKRMNLFQRILALFIVSHNSETERIKPWNGETNGGGDRR